MAHDADIAQKHLIKETRDSYEFNKIFNKLEKMIEQMNSLDQSVREMRGDIRRIKEHLGLD